MAWPAALYNTLGPSLDVEHVDQPIAGLRQALEAASVTEVVAVWLTYRSYHAPHNSDAGGTGAPDIPTTRRALDSAVDACVGRDRDDTATLP